MSNPSFDYKQNVLANLPDDIKYDPKDGFFSYNGHKFPTFLQAKWYRDYIKKFERKKIESLFRGTEGVWYDPSDLTTLFQDHFGTIPAAYGQPVGMVLDKSKGGLGPELGLLGTYVKDTDTALTITLGGPITSGKTYQVRFEVEGKNVSTPSVGIGSWASSIGISQTGDFTFTATLLGTGTAAVLVIQGNLARLSVRNVSVREILGNPASQPTATARPTLGRMPKGGRRNLLIRTEDYSLPEWTVGTQNTTPVEVFPGINGVQIEGLPQFAVYDRTNGTWIIPATDWPVTSGRFSATFTAPTGCDVANLYLSRGTPQIYSSASNSVVEPGETYTISMHVNDGKVGGVQYERGAVMTPYQRVGSSAYDVTEQGIPSLSYLDFDGVDDRLLFDSPTNGVADWLMVYSRPDTDMSYLMANQNDTGNYIFAMAVGTNPVTENGSGTPSYLINGVPPLAKSRRGLSDALGTGVTKVLEAQNVDFSSWPNAAIGSVSGVPTIKGRVSGLFICSQMSEDDRNMMRQYFAKKAGVTL